MPEVVPVITTVFISYTPAVNQLQTCQNSILPAANAETTNPIPSATTNTISAARAARRILRAQGAANCGFLPAGML